MSDGARPACRRPRSATRLTIIGVSLAAFLLHGYVGFIFSGSIKANPWWSTPLMPIVFSLLDHGVVIALVMLMYSDGQDL